jgi:SAM-dependent methyltransferase
VAGADHTRSPDHPRSREGSSEATIREFTRQAASFELPGSHFGDLELLEWIAAHVQVRSEDRLLDVAGGTGQLGRYLGRRAHLTVVADLTPAMLATGAEAARGEGRADIVFVQCDAAALPFPDAHFEVLVSRFALHHLADIGAVLREMHRVCAPSGSVTVIDMVAEPDASGVRLDELERLRDASHGRCPRESELQELLRAAGLRLRRSSSRDQALLAEPWLERAHPQPAARAAVMGALRGEVAGGAATGLHGADTAEGLTVSHRYLLCGCTPE